MVSYFAGFVKITSGRWNTGMYNWSADENILKKDQENYTILKKNFE